MKPLTLRQLNRGQLNRATLARQLLLERVPLDMVRATLMRETLHLVTAEDYPHDAVAMATYFRTLRPNHLPEGVDMTRVVELAGHAAEALAESTTRRASGRSGRTATSCRRSSLTGTVAGTWWWRRKKDVATLEATPFVKLTNAQRAELEQEAQHALAVLEPGATTFEVEYC